MSGYENFPETYYFVINLRNERVGSLELLDNAHKKGFCEINGVSFEGVTSGNSSLGNDFIVFLAHKINDSTSRVD